MDDEKYSEDPDNWARLRKDFPNALWLGRMEDDSFELSCPGHGIMYVSINHPLLSSIKSELQKELV